MTILSIQILIKKLMVSILRKNNFKSEVLTMYQVKMKSKEVIKYLSLVYMFVNYNKIYTWLLVIIKLVFLMQNNSDIHNKLHIHAKQQQCVLLVTIKNMNLY